MDVEVETFVENIMKFVWLTEFEIDDDPFLLFTWDLDKKWYNLGEIDKNLEGQFFVCFACLLIFESP